MNTARAITNEPKPLLDQLAAALSWFDAQLTLPSDRAELAGWQASLSQIRAADQQPMDSAIALMGESGAGKSSLLNALLGLDLLPHDAGSAVTASVTEIRHGDRQFRIHAEVESRESFLPRFSQICERLRETWTESSSNEAALAVAVDESEASIVRSVVGMEPAELFKHTRPGEEHTLLHPEVKKVLDAGTELTRAFAEDDSDELRVACRACLSSRHPLWPLMRRVTIEGPFPLLSSGLRLVDVPGLNDPDPVRNRIAQQALQSAQLVWLVLNAKRAMTGEIMRFLTESRLLTKLELEGRLGSLVAVATHADQFDDAGLTQAFDLTEDADLQTLLNCHRERVEKEVRRSLRRAWEETVAAAGEHVNADTAAGGRRRLEETPFFSVSSTESLLLRRIVRSKKPPVLERDEQTGIPQLARWIATDFVAREQRTHRQRVERQALQLRDAIRSTLARREDIKRKLAGLGTAQKGGLKGSQERARTFLEERLADHHAHAQKETEAQAERVRAAMQSGMQAAEDELAQGIPDRLAGIHHMTLRAICRRGGVFYGSTRNWDLPADIADAITKRVVFRWAELFENSAKGFLDDVARKSTDLLSLHAHFLFDAIVQLVGDGIPGLDRLKQPTRQLQFELDMVRPEITESLQSARMSFERDLVNMLREHLGPAFERAADERGVGMKQRMVQALCANLDAVAPTLLPALARDLDERVVEVNVILVGQVGRAHDSVRRVAQIEEGNLKVALFETTPDELIRTADILARGLSMLDAA
ncbi:MAG: dynamin family protein [Phycisphaerales bacterium]|nr:dynamin family protein [Phycisphaerales bacterium]